MSDTLRPWRDTPTRQAIVEFVESVTREDSADYLPPPERVAVFDNDGTLWCEKPMPIELGFILIRLAEMADKDASLRDRQPWKAACERDFAWLGAVITEHYHGNDSDVKVLMGGILRAFAGITVEEYATAADVFDDGDTKPVRIWSRIGRRPVVAGGNSNGDIPMLHYAGGPSRSGLRLLLLHDDPEREFDYTAGAEKSLEQAHEGGWTLVSIKNDWATVFADTGG